MGNQYELICDCGFSGILEPVNTRYNQKQKVPTTFHCPECGVEEGVTIKQI
jgi:hypothetical protein